MNVILNDSPLARWRRQLGRWRRGLAQEPQRAPLAAMGYLLQAPVIEHLVEIEQLVLVVLYELPRPQQAPILRVAGYGAQRVAHGVKWGGREQHRFSKSLAIAPQAGGAGLRLDLGRPKLLDLALRLEGDVNRHRRYRCRPRPAELRLPQLWAGFRAGVAASLTGAGPEIEASAAELGMTPEQLMRSSWRSYSGLKLYPLDWVSHRANEAAAVFADLQTLPRRTVYEAPNLQNLLQGFQGAVEYDFWESRFSS